MTLIRCIDFETTGMPEDDPVGICEVGWCDILTGPPGTSISAPVSILCNPGHPIPPQARAVHHISDDDVAKAVAPDEALTRVFLNDPDYFVAHNAKFEQAFFDAGSIPWICTYKVALRLWPDAPAHSNQVLRYCLNLDLREDEAMPPHRAGPDAYVTAHILKHMLDVGTTSLEEMAHWSSGPPLLPRINFGKHRGSKWEDVPSDYLDWIVSKSDMDSDIKANARHHLMKRGKTA